jgi:ankyrin repeat protein
VKRLLEALKRDNLVALRKLLASGEIDLSQEILVGEEYELDEPDEVPLLFFAISNGASLEAIEMLVDAGIDITDVNREGVGALDIAIKYKRMDVIVLCEAQGINLFESRRKSGITPLILAASFNDMEIVSYLIEKGVDVHSTDKYGMTAADYAKRMGQKKMLAFLERQGKS